MLLLWAPGVVLEGGGGNHVASHRHVQLHVAVFNRPCQRIPGSRGCNDTCISIWHLTFHIRHLTFDIWRYAYSRSSQTGSILNSMQSINSKLLAWYADRRMVMLAFPCAFVAFMTYAVKQHMKKKKKKKNESSIFRKRNAPTAATATGCGETRLGDSSPPHTSCNRCGGNSQSR